MVQYKRALPVGFAIVLAISCIVAWFVGYQRELERQRHEVNTAAAITIEACLPSIETLRFGEFTHCLVEVFQADPDALREKFDLKAQQDMALWAFGMLLVSMVGVIITAAGTIYIAATLKEARETTKAAKISAEEARKATITAQEAVAVAREMGAAQIRAYLAVREVGENPERRGDLTLEDKFKVVPFFINSGASPALNVRMKTVTGSIQNGGAFVPHFPDFDNASNGSVGAGVPFGAPSEEMTLSDWTSPNTENSGQSRTIAVYYSYSDVFGTSYKGYVAWKLSIHSLNDQSRCSYIVLSSKEDRVD